MLGAACFHSVERGLRDHIEARYWDRTQTERKRLYFSATSVVERRWSTFNSRKLAMRVGKGEAGNEMRRIRAEMEQESNGSVVSLDSRRGRVAQGFHAEDADPLKVLLAEMERELRRGLSMRAWVSMQSLPNGAERRALEMRAKGEPWAYIAATIGRSTRQAQRIAQQGYDRLRRQLLAESPAAQYLYGESA